MVLKMQQRTSFGHPEGIAMLNTGTYIELFCFAALYLTLSKWLSLNFWFAFILTIIAYALYAILWSVIGRKFGQNGP
jgi:hypothetical protein